MLRLGGDQRSGALLVAWYVVFGALAFLTAHGIDQQTVWGKWLGYGLGVLSLLNIPIGTIIGIAILVYISRASKAGLFTKASSPA